MTEEGNVDRLERIAGRVAHAVGSEQSPEDILESASLVSELASEFEAEQRRADWLGEEHEARRAGSVRTVLLAEPDPEERAAIRDILHGLGYAVLEAENGMCALEICREQPGAIDLMLTNVFMQDITGRELAERAALLQPGIAVLYCSAYEASDVLHFGMLGRQAVIVAKPVTVEALARALREAFETEYAR
jgi:CheY-like chemotaxis protein